MGKENFCKRVAELTTTYIDSISALLQEAKPKNPSNEDSILYMARGMAKANLPEVIIAYVKGVFIPAFVEEGNDTTEEGVKTTLLLKEFAKKRKIPSTTR